MRNGILVRIRKELGTYYARRGDYGRVVVEGDESVGVLLASTLGGTVIIHIPKKDLEVVAEEENDGPAKAV